MQRILYKDDPRCPAEITIDRHLVRIQYSEGPDPREDQRLEDLRAQRRRVDQAHTRVLERVLKIRFTLVCNIKPFFLPVNKD